LSYPGERRAEQRQVCDCNIVWAYFNKDHLVSAKMLNCSRAGCYLETPQRLTIGSTVLIRLERSAAGNEKTVSGPVRSSAVAEVKWCDRRDRRYGVGVRYHFSG
jgi:Tfp pilus assembly protein PilZ